MNANPRDEGSTGKFVRACQGMPAGETDCSGWEADVPAEQWSTGRFVAPTQQVPAVGVDCSAWEAGQPVWIELVVSFRDDTPPARVIEHTNRMIGVVHAADPELGLTYDFTRSRAEGGDVVIALSPRRQDDSKGRLERLVEVAATQLAKLQAGARVVIRVAA